MSSQHDADTRNELFFLFDFNRNACDNELIDCLSSASILQVDVFMVR